MFGRAAASPGLFAHVVHTQPAALDAAQLDRSRAALAACPVGAIRVENSAKINHANKAAGGGGMRLSTDDEVLARSLAISPRFNGLERPFPRPLLSGRDIGVHYLGHHHDESFGAVPYLAQGLDHRGREVSVMVDTPRFSSSAVKAVVSLAGPDGPDYLFLSHVDDVSDHDRWAAEFPALRRIFHEGDLGRYNWREDHSLDNVEVLLRGEQDGSGGAEAFRAWNLDGEDAKLDDLPGDFAVLHTPGHSPGSISLLFRGKGGEQDSAKVSGPEERKGVLFTGDTYAYSTRDGGSMSGFPQYCKQGLVRQADTLRRLKNIVDLWDVVAPGHGHPRDYISNFDGLDSEQCRVVKAKEIQDAVEGLMQHQRAL